MIDDSNKNRILTPDFCVIGAGAAGLSFAAGAVQMGASVVLVEKSMMGGDCLNTGCVPSKSLIAAAKAGHDIEIANRFGWFIEDKPKLKFSLAMDYVQSRIDKIAPHDSVERFQKLGVQVIQEEATFLDEKTLTTRTYNIKPKRFIIATGSKAAVPNINGIKHIKYHTNESIFKLKKLPNELIIIGGGPIGIEMAQTFSRLGSKVTILEAKAILPKDDDDFVDSLKHILLSESIDIFENVKIESLHHVDDDNMEINYIKNNQVNSINCDCLLVATGRTPNISSLNLGAADVNYNDKGIVVNSMLCTTNKKIYAIGDCVGSYQFTHVAGYHASIAIQNTIFKLRRKVSYAAVPWVTYSDPELSQVGVLEKYLIKDKIKYKKLELNFTDNDRAITNNKTTGKIKVLVDKKGYVLGVTILGDRAGELIYPWVMVIQNKQKISSIAKSIAPYPTLNDINKRIAGMFYADKIFGKGAKKIVKFIMRLTK